MLHHHETQENNFSRLCNFYTGEGHFFTSSIFYLLRRIDEGAKIILFSTGYIKQLIYQNIYKRQRKNIFFYPIEAIQSEDTEKHFNEYAKNILGIITDSKNNQEFVICVQNAQSINKKLFNDFEKVVRLLKKPIEIIYCYEIMDENMDIKKVINNNTHILKTTGIHRIDTMDIVH